MLEAKLPDRQQLERFLRADSPLLALVEECLRDQRRQLLERFPSQRTPDEFLRLQAQVLFIDLLIESLREELLALWIEKTTTAKG